MARSFARLTERGIFLLWLLITVPFLVVTSTVYATYESGHPPELLAEWSGLGTARTETFQVGAGSWTYCAAISGAKVDESWSNGQTRTSTPSLRVSLYRPDGTWMGSVSGQGEHGDLECGELDGPGEFELRITDSVLWEVEWVLRVEKARSEAVSGLDLAEGRSAQSELPSLVSYVNHEPPIAVDGTALYFEGNGSAFTSLFRPVGDSWSLCWELYSAPPESNVVSSTEYWGARLFIEQEPGDFGRWTDRASGSTSKCVEVESTQPFGRHWLLVEEGGHERAWRLAIRGVELSD